MNRTIAPHVHPSEKRLSNFNSAGDGCDEGSITASVTITEGLGAGVEPALGWVADVEVTDEELHAIRVRRPSSGSITKSSAKFLEGAFGLVSEGQQPCNSQAAGILIR